jgi:adenine-specific DNA-methyltransferase
MGAKVFDNPKDHEEVAKLLKYMLGASASSEEIVLDFFAGSGTTAEAVAQLNHERGTSHKFILVQLPEPCDPKERSGKAALNAGLYTIADVTKERVRRVIKKQNDEDANKLDLNGGQKQDRGFRVFKLAESNFQVWNTKVPQDDVSALEKQLEIHVDHIRGGRTDDDLLYEILLKSGYPLTTTVEKLSVDRKSFYSVAGGLLLLCLEKELTGDLIKAMADRKPERVVCLDEGFAGNDQLKTNAVQTMKAKGVTSFKTV